MDRRKVIEDRELFARRFCTDHATGKMWSEDEINEAIQFIERVRLDPFTRQVYLQRRWVKPKKDREGKEIGRGYFALQCTPTIDGFRIMSERTGEYQGIDGPYWCGPDGKWRDVWLDTKNKPSAAKVGVRRVGFETVWCVATMEAYAVQYSPMWQGAMAPVMLGKCAEAGAHRKAFPNVFSDVYSVEEMQQASKDEPASQPEPEPQRAIEQAVEPLGDDRAGELIELIVAADLNIDDLRSQILGSSKIRLSEAEVQAMESDPSCWPARLHSGMLAWVKSQTKAAV